MKLTYNKVLLLSFIKAISNIEVAFLIPKTKRLQPLLKTLSAIKIAFHRDESHESILHSTFKPQKTRLI
ncbi:hypothetical protein CW732_07855 [Olleya sp. Bg11-27]|nr:hypothetical protein CW732_07855 [Olleya sp. Bg11-27]